MRIKNLRKKNNPLKMHKQLKKQSLMLININPFGVHSCISRHGILLSYALGSDDEIELYYPDMKSALNALSVSNLDEVTGFDLAGLYFAA